MDSWVEELMDNPINEFYDKNTARTSLTVPHAFNLNTFIERFRTLDDEGNKLVSASANPAGETVIGADGNTYIIGSQITTQNRLLYVNVCAPSHIILNIGINDCDGLNSVESSVSCFKILFNCFGELPTAHFVFRYPGVCYKGLWSDVAIALQYKVRLVQTKLMEMLTALDVWIDNDTQGDKEALDVWHTQYPASSYLEKLEDSGDYPNSRVDCSYEDVHVGYFAHKSAAWQCLCWLYNKLV